MLVLWQLVQIKDIKIESVSTFPNFIGRSTNHPFVKEKNSFYSTHIVAFNFKQVVIYLQLVPYSLNETAKRELYTRTCVFLPVAGAFIEWSAVP